MSDIQIHLDEDNELRFGVAVEGAESGRVELSVPGFQDLFYSKWGAFKNSQSGF